MSHDGGQIIQETSSEQLGKPFWMWEFTEQRMRTREMAATNEWMDDFGREC